MLEKEYAFFEKNRENFVKQHKDEYVLIKDEEIIGFFKDRQKALEEASKKYKLGTFLIHQCVGKNDEIHRFHSRVSFG